MRISFFTLIFLLLFNTYAFANHSQDHNHSDIEYEKTQKNITITEDGGNLIVAKINGLVCDFCARALEKVFSKRDEVTAIEVNLDTKLVTISLKKGMDIDDNIIKSLINDAGYNTVEIKR